MADQAATAAEWADYERGNQHANNAYTERAKIIRWTERTCRHPGCGRVLPNYSDRKFHEALDHDLAGVA